MKLKHFEDGFPWSFRNLKRKLNIPQVRPQEPPLVGLCRADDSEFCMEAVERGWLTEEQLHRAAERYQLGKSRSGKTIYWLINKRGVGMDGHLGDQWVMELLKRRYPEAASYVRVRHCLFGSHLLKENANGNKVAIVEQERTAVVLSEWFPAYVWLAYNPCLTLDLLEPLSGAVVRLFPRTDNTMASYLAWCDLATLARRTYHLNITVSKVLEKNATPEQKERCIDLLDFLCEQRE